MHSIRIAKKYKLKKGVEMKKFVLTILVVLLVLTACGNQVETPVPTVVIEPIAQSEQPTQPPVVETEEPIETAVPTEEPTTEPVEVPTEEPTDALTAPDRCPAESFQIPENLGDWTLNLGEYGEFVLLDIDGRSLFLVSDISYLIGAQLEKGEKSIASFATEGGTISFEIPSPAFLKTEVDLDILVDGEQWTFEPFASSPTGGYVIPADANVQITSMGGQNPEAVVLELYFLSGNPVDLIDISVDSENYRLICNDYIWELTIENPGDSDQEVLVGSNGLFFFSQEESEGSILVMKLLLDGEEFDIEMEYLPGLAFFEEDLSVLLKGNTEVRFLFLSTFVRE